MEFHERDVLYRKHFNAHDVPKARMLKKGTMSLEGLMGDWLKATPAQPPPAPGGEAAPSKPCVVVVDCFSTGAMVAHLALDRSYSVVRVDSFDNPDLAAMVASNCRTDYDEFFTFEMDEQAGLQGSLARLKDRIDGTGLKVTAVVAGAETGVELADRLR